MQIWDQLPNLQLCSATPPHAPPAQHALHSMDIQCPAKGDMNAARDPPATVADSQLRRDEGTRCNNTDAGNTLWGGHPGPQQHFGHKGDPRVALNSLTTTAQPHTMQNGSPPRVATGAPSAGAHDTAASVATGGAVTAAAPHCTTAAPAAVTVQELMDKRPANARSAQHLSLIHISEPTRPY